MPIKPENRARYPKTWKAIVEEIRSRAGGRCECLGECGLGHPCHPGCRIEAGILARRCCEVGGVKAHTFNGPVILTTAHLHHARRPEEVRRHLLKSMCQRCHLRYDRHQHAETARRTRAARP